MADITRPDLRHLQAWIDAMTGALISLQDHQRHGMSEAEGLRELGTLVAMWHRDYKTHFPKNSFRCDPFTKLEDPNQVTRASRKKEVLAKPLKEL